jgi:prepilin-type N-terminal cleavage/methylation domain-containing protein
MRVQKNSGFTLLEVVLVLVIAGIIGVVVASRFVGVDTNMVVQTDVVKTHLRYAQIRAMSSNAIWGINFQGTTYSFFKNGNTADTVYFPGEESLTIDLPSGKSASEIVSFDSWGKPHTDAAGLVPRASLAVGDLAVIVTENTGFVQ